MMLNYDITSKILDILLNGILNPSIQYHVNLLIVCKSWTECICKYIHTYHLCNIKYSSILNEFTGLHTLCIGDQNICDKYANRFYIWLLNNPSFCSRITTFSTISVNSIVRIVNKFINLKCLILRSVVIYQEEEFPELHVPLLIVYMSNECSISYGNITSDTQIFFPEAYGSRQRSGVRYAIFHSGLPDHNEMSADCIRGDYDILDNYEFGLEDCIVSIANTFDEENTVYIDQDFTGILTEDEKRLIGIARNGKFKLELIRTNEYTYTYTDKDIITKYISDITLFK